MATRVLLEFSSCNNHNSNNDTNNIVFILIHTTRFWHRPENTLDHSQKAEKVRCNNSNNNNDNNNNNSNNHNNNDR